MVSSVMHLIKLNILKPRVLEPIKRTKVTFRSGALKPMPIIQPFGMMGIIFTVVPGLLIGALISKNIANFLEENDLFVPSDDDEDD
ncbi:unnamed protein product [Diamesa tonsa]